jgi:glycosyltransferase involved in cell wall biosynthesis
MHVEICICTHNPRIDVLDRVMKSIFNQQVTAGHTFSVLVVNNLSDPAISESIFRKTNGSKIKTKLIQEPSPGVARARAMAAKSTSAEWILFVDDDNELSSDYVSKGLGIIRDHPTLGCFGGRLLLPDSIHPPAWTKPFLPYLGIKDFGEERIERLSEEWGPWEPPTAGAFVHRDVLQEYLRRSTASENFFQLGRTAEKLLSCEDSILMRGAASLGRTNAYEPSLVLWHHLAPHRFRFRYLIRLMYGYGISHVILEALCKGPQPIPEYYKSERKFLKMILVIFMSKGVTSVQFAIGMVTYHLGARREHFSQQSGMVYEKLSLSR